MKLSGWEVVLPLLLCLASSVVATTTCPQGMTCFYASPAGSNSTQCPTQCGLSQSCPCGTLQDTLDMVPNNTTVQSAILAAPGTYTGTGNAELQFNGRPVYLVSEEGSEATSISCLAGERAFLFNHGEGRQTAVSGFTLEGCSVLVANSKLISLFPSG